MIKYKDGVITVTPNKTKIEKLSTHLRISTAFNVTVKLKVHLPKGDSLLESIINRFFYSPKM